MNDYVTLTDVAKLKVLQAQDFQAPWPSLEHKNWCLHCEQEFDGHSVRIWQDRGGSFWLECGTPGCSGSPIDWAPYPWWDENHPVTKQHIRDGDDPSLISC